MDVKRELIKSSNNIRKKYMALKRGVAEEEAVIKKKFKPIVEPITDLVKNIKNKNITLDNIDKIRENNEGMKINEEEGMKINEIGDEYDDDDDDGQKSEESNSSDDEEVTVDSYIKKCIRDVKNEMDHTYGVYNGKNGWMIGNSIINFTNNRKNIKIKNKEFKVTKGLLELLFKKRPLQKYISTVDLQNYKSILILSSAHLLRHSEGERINGTKSPKYRLIINKLFKKGQGLNEPYLKAQPVECAPEYIPYSNINDIVDRLRTLKASEAAGNNSHRNEEIHIVNELRRQGVIY